MFYSHHEIYQMELGRRADILKQQRVDSRVQHIRRQARGAKSTSNLLAKLSSALLQWGSFR